MSTAVATQQPSIASLLDKMKPQLAAALPKTMNADRMARIALTAFRTTPALQKCDPQSFIASVMQAAQLGLEPNLNGSAYLVPYGNQVQMIPGYRGLIDLARRSGAVQSISAEIVYEGDAFKLSLGVENKIEHAPKLDGERGQFKLVYAVAKFNDGGYQFIWMTKAQVDAIRSRSKASKSGPWVTDYEEMVKKTAIRRLCKMLPMSVELANAVALSDAADAGVRPIIDGDIVMMPAINSEPEEEEGGDKSEPKPEPQKDDKMVLQAMPPERFEAEYPGWKKLVAAGKNPADLAAMVGSKWSLAIEQHAKIMELPDVIASEKAGGGA